MKVLAINGSPRKGGNTRLLIDIAAKELERAGIQVETVELGGFEVRPCTACRRCSKKAWDCPQDDDAVEILRKMAGADGILIGSPVYFGGVTAQLKALFDRSLMPYRGGELKDKIGGAVSVGGSVHGGQELTVMQIIAFYLTHDMAVANAGGGLYGAMGVADEKGAAAKDKDGTASAESLGRRMAHMLDAAAKQKTRDAP